MMSDVGRDKTPSSARRRGSSAESGKKSQKAASINRIPHRGPTATGPSCDEKEPVKKDLIPEELREQFDSLIPEDCSPLQFLLIVMRFKPLPVYTRVMAAREAAPYVHAKNPAPPSDPTKRTPAIVVPGAMTVQDWEKLSSNHRTFLEALKKEHGE